MPRFIPCLLVFVLGSSAAWADPPVASYIFPAGGQRGTTVKVRVGGLNLHKSCGAEMLGSGVQLSPKLQRTNTVWFEGALLPLPDSQRQEDYPKDMAGEVKIAADAPLGLRYWRVWTAQGATPAMKFMVGDLPEMIEEEIAGEPIPVPVTLPVTINGRIFPRADVDVWSFAAKKGQAVTCEVNASRLGSPLEARLEITDPEGRRLAENDLDRADPVLRFEPPVDGVYHVRIHDIKNGGGQAYVYRLTLTAGPYADHVFPLGGRGGSKVSFELAGANLPATTQVQLPSHGEYVSQSLALGGQKTNPVLLDLDELDEVMESSSPVKLPCVANGRIGVPGEIDAWTIPVKKGEPLEAELRASRLGSLLDGVLTLFDAAGKELVRVDQSGPLGDPVLRYTAAQDGSVTLKVQDRFRGRGGPAFAYRLRLTKGAVPPDFRLSFKSDALTVPRGQQVQLPITLDRLGNFQDVVALTIDNLPKGVTVDKAVIAAKQNATTLILKVDKDAAITAGRLTVRGTAKLGAANVTRTARQPMGFGAPDLESVLLAVALPTPFKIKGVYEVRWLARGTVLERKYQIERTGYDGPIEVSMADKQARHLQGVTGPTITVPAGAKEFIYKVQLPPWMDMGRTSRSCVMGVAVLKDNDGQEHEVSFTSVNQNEQMVAVIEPGKLAVNVDNPTLAARPGQSATAGVKVSRAPGLKGDVQIEVVVPGHLKGIQAEKLVIPAGQEQGLVQFRFGADLSFSINVPLVVRATLIDNGRPVMAEAQFELVRLK